MGVAGVGLGGQIAVADITRGLSYAYLTNHLSPLMLVDPASQELADVLYEVVRTLRMQQASAPKVAHSFGWTTHSWTQFGWTTFRLTTFNWTPMHLRFSLNKNQVLAISPLWRVIIFIPVAGIIEKISRPV